MSIRRTPLVSDELKIAKKLADIVSDLRIDLELVGTYLAEVAPAVSFRRLVQIVEAADFEREQQDVRRSHHTLF